MPHNTEMIHNLNKDLFVKIKISNIPRPSFIWNYFGHLYKQPSEPLDIEREYIVKYALIK